MRPTIAGFILFIRQVMDISAINLPDASPAILAAFENSKEIVSLQIEQASPRMYANAVYNLGGDYLINWAPDQTGSKYFTNLRKRYKITAFVAGVISSASDEATAETLLVPDFFKGLTFSDLQNLKTPFGRAYLEIAQRVGTLWGLT